MPEGCRKARDERGRRPEDLRGGIVDWKQTTGILHLDRDVGELRPVPVESLRGLAGIVAGIAIDGRYRPDELEDVGDDDLEEELREVRFDEFSVGPGNGCVLSSCRRAEQDLKSPKEASGRIHPS